MRQFGSWGWLVEVGRDPILGRRLRHEPEFWRATLDGNWTLYFHPPDVPLQVWAVSIQPAGVIWAEVDEVGRITERNVTVRYAGENARLNREKLWRSWALWRGVHFVSSRSGHAANLLDAIWQDRYGRASSGVPPVMQMALAEAMALLKVPANYTKEEVIAAFRREAKKAHPDAGRHGRAVRRAGQGARPALGGSGHERARAKAADVRAEGNAHDLSPRSCRRIGPSRLYAAAGPKLSVIRASRAPWRRRLDQAQDDVAVALAGAGRHSPGAG
jgi:hypothetical protein